MIANPKKLNEMQQKLKQMRMAVPLAAIGAFCAHRNRHFNEYGVCVESMIKPPFEKRYGRMRIRKHKKSRGQMHTHI